VEVLSSPLTCFNASHYGALLIVDPEEEYYAQVGYYRSKEICNFVSNFVLRHTVIQPHIYSGPGGGAHYALVV
jgi:hypothetical protein